MFSKHTALAVALTLSASVGSAPAGAQDVSKYSEDAVRQELGDKALAETIVMIPMRDGVSLAANIYRPKAATGKLPTILSKTPYNGVGDFARTNMEALKAVSRGYAYVVQSERGRYFSEGQYEILGKPQTDGYDTLSWIDQALHRLTRSGDIRRIARGLYDKPQFNSLTRKPTNPDPRTIVDALARRDQARIIVHTDARLKPIKLGSLQIDLKTTAPSKLHGAGRPAMRVVQALHWLHDIAADTDAAVKKRLATILADPKHGRAIADDLAGDCLRSWPGCRTFCAMSCHHPQRRSAESDPPIMMNADYRRSIAITGPSSQLSVL